MKLIIQVFLLLYPAFSFGQTVTITLSTGDCRNQEAYSFYGADTILFYRYPEDTLVYKIIPRHYSQWPIKIENVLIGNYKLKYKNSFGQEIEENYTVNAQNINNVIICPDKLLSYTENTLSKLQNNDTISINFYSEGCFNSDRLNLKIIKEDEKLIAKLYSVFAVSVKTKRKKTIDYKDGSLLKTSILNKDNVQAFIRFENELKLIRNGGCTTTDLYKIKSKYLNVEKVDGNCNWNGFHYLTKSFFGEKE